MVDSRDDRRRASAHRGILLVISSPSGAGKTTLAHRLAEQERLEFSVSYTTRPPRPGETRRRRLQVRHRGRVLAGWSSATSSPSGRGPRQPLRHRRPHRQPRARGRQGLPVRHRLPGRARRSGGSGRRESVLVLHPAALDGRARAAAAPARHRRARGDRAPAGHGQARARALRRVRLPGRERQPRHARSRSCQPSMWRPAARARRRGHYGHALLRRGADRGRGGPPSSSQ